jgi:putative intracellular protease/amidase
VPLPDRDFDPTEVSVPWQLLKSAGHDVVFATERGEKGACDPFMITGVVFGKLGALPENVARYRELENDPAFTKPITYDAIVPSEFHALLLPGGHAKGMRQYLESTTLQSRTKQFLDDDKLVGAICHGGVALVRSGAAAGRRMTALPKWMERLAYYATAWKVGDYYRTYPEYVEDECRRLCGAFESGPKFSMDYDKPFLVEDKNVISARWPGDAKSFGEKLVERLSS